MDVHDTSCRYYGRWSMEKGKILTGRKTTLGYKGGPKLKRLTVWKDSCVRSSVNWPGPYLSPWFTRFAWLVFYRDYKRFDLEPWGIKGRSSPTTFYSLGPRRSPVKMGKHLVRSDVTHGFPRYTLHSEKYKPGSPVDPRITSQCRRSGSLVVHRDSHRLPKRPRVRHPVPKENHTWCESKHCEGPFWNPKMYDISPSSKM